MESMSPNGWCKVEGFLMPPSSPAGLRKRFGWRCHSLRQPGLLILASLLIFSFRVWAGDPTYKGLVKIPTDLATPEGTVLEKGQYELEVKPDGQGATLQFSLQGHLKLTVKAIQVDDAALASARIPLIGTHFLTSSADRVLTGQERQRSKTGAAQYEEEKRDWKATLRAYQSPEEGAVYFLVQLRGAGMRWNRIVFKLALRQKSPSH